jgi:cbb3-type cytochrome oxidase subunit 1
MNYLRRMQMERPVLFWVLTLVAFWVAFRLILMIAALLLGPFSLPSWAPLVVVVGVLVLIARRQQRR